MFSLLISISMFVGSTYAWLSKTVDSGSNIIQSKNLKVSMMWMDGESNPDTKGNVWKNASNEAIFESISWEPDTTVVRHIKIENEGNIAVKYKFNIFPNTEVSINQKLAEVIDVYCINSAIQVPQGKEEEVLTSRYKLGTLRDVVENNASGFNIVVGMLQPGESTILTIALKMQSPVSGDYQALSLENYFYVQLHAEQIDNDAFDISKYAGLEIIETGDTIETKDNIQYLHKANGEKILYFVLEEYTGNTLTVPDDVTAIGSYAFYYNRNIEKIILGSKVTTIKDNAFRGTSAAEIILNEGLQTIGYRVFKNADSLTSIAIPSSVTTIGNEAFNSCRNLSTVILYGTPTFAGTGITFSNLESGLADKITIYVLNDTVASNIRNANTSCTEYKVILYEAVTTVEQLKSAMEAGKNVVLGADIDLGTETITVAANSDVILDLNGHSITKTVATPQSLIVNYGTLEINDSGKTGTISIIFNETVDNSAEVSAILNAGVLNVNGGTVGTIYSFIHE